MIDSRLQLLIAVSEHGTVTAAAEAQYRSPSGVSKHLRQLAAELDVDLLERQGRRVELTPAGERLVAHARVLNAQWETALSDTAAAARRLCGPVTIGGFPTAISAIITSAAAHLVAERPQLRPIVKETYSTETLPALESGQIDVGILVPTEATGHVQDRFVEVSDLLDDPIDLLVPAEHPFAERERVTLADAAHEQWITGHPHQDAYTELLAATKAVGYAPRACHHAQELTATTALVAAGLGIAAVPRIAMTIPHPNIRQIPLAGEHIPRRRILIATRRGARNNPRITATVTALRDSAHEASGGDA